MSFQISRQFQEAIDSPHRDQITRLLQENEGKLFVNRFFTSMFSKTFFFHEDFYTIKDGIIYILEPDGTIYASEDDIYTLLANCQLIGVYDPKNHPKKRYFKPIEYEELSTFLNNYISKC